MAASDTFNCPPIAGFVQKYLLKSRVSIDPFARNNRFATYRNDINYDTAAHYHMDAEDFLFFLSKGKIRADLVLFDPPYSPYQVIATYNGVGLDRDGKGRHNGALYSRVRRAIPAVLAPGGIVLSFGWNSNGMGLKHGFEILEILLVAHGGAHNDTICMAERYFDDGQATFGAFGG